MTFFVLSNGASAHAATRWQTLAGPSTQIVSAAGDDVDRLSYAQAGRLHELDAQTLGTRRIVQLPFDDCGPRAMALAATLIDCREDAGSVELVTPSGQTEVLASAALDIRHGPVEVFAFGDQWLQRYYGNPPGGPGYTDFLNWHTGQVIADQRFPVSDYAAADLDDATPANPHTCAPGYTLDRRGSRYIMYRPIDPIHVGPATIYLTRCGPHPSSSRLGTVATDRALSGRLSVHQAIWASRNHLSAVTLATRHTYHWTFRQARPSAHNPLRIGQAAHRVIVAIQTRHGTIIKTATVS